MANRIPAALAALVLLAACETAGPATAPGAAGPQAAPGGAAPGAATLALASADPADFSGLLARAGAGREVKAELYVPADAKGPLPVVVIAHGEEGITERERMYAGELMRAGFAAVIPDSLGARGGDEGALSYAAQLNDVAAAYKAVGADSRFDRRRVGVLGFSRGGTVAYLAAHAPFLRAVAGGDARFAAHLPAYPHCDWRLDRFQAAAAPVMFLFAEKDDWTPAETCLPVVVSLTQAGNAVASKRYANTFHAFDSAPVAVRKRPEVRRLADCTNEIDAKGETSLEGKGLRRGQVSLDGDFRAYREAALDRCGRAGVTTGAELDWRGNTTTDAVGFFTESLKNGKAVL
jgi:dienelactone hydrolase